MAHPVAGFAAVSAIGFGVAGHMMGLVAGTMAGAMDATPPDNRGLVTMALTRCRRF